MMNTVTAKHGNALSVGELVLTQDGIYRWEGEDNSKLSHLNVTHDERFNGVPTICARLEDIAPAALSLSIDIGDMRLSVVQNKEYGEFSIDKWLSFVEGEEWKGWGFTEFEALMRAARFMAIRDWHKNGCPTISHQPSSFKPFREVLLDTVLDDFEPGDTIFRYEEDSSYTLTGEVLSVEEDHLRVQYFGTSSAPLEVTIAGDKDNFHHLSHWRKMPDTTKITIGDILSTTFPGYLSVPNGREHFKVTKIDPGKFLSLQSMENKYHSLDFTDYEYGSLEQYLQHWQIEG